MKPNPTRLRNLRIIRIARGLSQRELAKLSGFSNCYLSQVERLQRPASARAVTLWARHLDVPEAVLGGGDLALVHPSAGRPVPYFASAHAIIMAEGGVAPE